MSKVDCSPMCYKRDGLWFMSYIENGIPTFLAPVDDVISKHMFDMLQAKGSLRVEDDIEPNPEDDLDHYWIMNPRLSVTPERIALLNNMNIRYSNYPKLHAHKSEVRALNAAYLLNQIKDDHEKKTVS